MLQTIIDTNITAAILGEISYNLYAICCTTAHIELTFSARTFPKYCYHGYCNEYIVLCHYNSLCNLLLHKFIGETPHPIDTVTIKYHTADWQRRSTIIPNVDKYQTTNNW